MSQDALPPPAESTDERDAYRPPTVTVLGTLAELTQEKEVGASDGTMVLGIEVGS